MQQWIMPFAPERIQDDGYAKWNATETGIRAVKQYALQVPA